MGVHVKLHWAGSDKNSIVRCGMWLTLEQTVLWITDNPLDVTCGVCSDHMRADGELFTCQSCGLCLANRLDMEAHELSHL